MAYYLLVDFGSTYTKLTCVDLEHEEIIATSKAITTVESDVLDGYKLALSDLRLKVGKDIDFDGITACSSAAGGLKMAAIGLVEELTVEAAKRACLGAGAKVECVFSNKLNNSDLQLMIEKKIDIILLAGGTDGGNSENILYNAKKLANSNLHIPIVVAGNRNCNDEIEELFKQYKDEYHICENVMPKINVLNVDSAKEVIRKIFIDRIIESKGIKKAEELIGEIIMPTPEAVLEAASLLSIGIDGEGGIGDLILVDIGGATTDVHSIGNGDPTRFDCAVHGLEEPFAKRTVEGDLGMRYSALSLFDKESEKYIKSNISYDANIREELQRRYHDITFVPKTPKDIEFDEAMAKYCVDQSITRHVGKLSTVYTPMGMMYYQTGKDLSNVKYVIGTGGVLVHSKNYKEILSVVLQQEQKPMELRPHSTQFLVDSQYILAAMGLLSKRYPQVALNIMKKNLFKQ